MRLSQLLCLLAVTAIACAQDTNFAVGPQYLAPANSTLFLRPIATPTLSLSEPHPYIPSAASEETSTGETPTVPVIPSSQEFFARVYWGEHTPSEVTARLITTPTLSFSEPPPPPAAGTREETTQTPAQSAGGESAARQIEISSVERTRALPSVIVQVGVEGGTDAQALQKLQSGVSSGQAPSSAKTGPRAARVFTNRDIERLHDDSR